MASAMIRPMASSWFAEMVPTCAIMGPVTGLDIASSVQYGTAVLPAVADDRGQAAITRSAEGQLLRKSGSPLGTHHAA